MKAATINSRYILGEGCRFEGKYFLNAHALLSMVLYTHSSVCKPLYQMATVMNPPVFKRQFCQNTSNAVPYFQSSDVTLADENPTVFVYRPQAERLNAIVHKGDVLVTGFGTIGNTKLVSAHQEGACYANNVARIKPNKGVLTGYIYAVMSSKYGVAQLNKNASGSVVRYIESPGIKHTLIPDFPKEFQQEVDSLIQTSAQLREEAADAIAAAHKLIEENIPLSSGTSAGSTSIKRILQSHNHRFEASYYQTDNRAIYDDVIKNYTYKTLGQLTADIFRPGIFKRKFVESDGIMFLGGADIMMAIPSSEKMLSKSQVKDMPELLPQKGWILATCGGTIGKTVYVDSQLATCAVSQHVMRIVPNGEVPNGYLYAFLSSKIGYKLLTLFTYGSVIPQVEPHHLRLIPVPILAKQYMDAITTLVNEYVCKNEDSKSKERKAIRMVEAEIEKWNK